jgi:hypothetical protein
MKICYIISTCEKYLDTRVKYQMETFLKNVNREDIYYLTSKPDIPNRQFGWNCMDDFDNIPWKYIHFIYNMEIQDKYDWYIFIDDDTFVFENRLKNLLINYNSSENYYIGYELDHIKNDFCLYMSGGAGYAISNGLYNLIYNYVRKTGINNSFIHKCDDLCIGIWIQELKKDFIIHQINSDLFHVGVHSSEKELNTAISFHKVINEDQYIFYNSINEKEIREKISEKEITTNLIKEDTVFALITDNNYFSRAKKTIIDLRSKGRWWGPLVLITIDFDLNQNFKDYYEITEVKFPLIDKRELLNKIGSYGFKDTTDKREIYKLNQWEKFHIFDDYFLKWNKVIYLDSGLRVLEDVKYLLEIDCNNKILAPNDGYLGTKFFKDQISFDKPELIEEFKNEFNETIFNSNYMLNCVWIYDTNILNLCNKTELIKYMNKYTFCKTNEMGIMNILFHFKYKLWEILPEKISTGKNLFDWAETNNNWPLNWKGYCLLKYPVTISFDDC